MGIVFIYVLYPVIDRIIICLIPLEILLVGYLGTSNRTFKSNVESYELAKVKFKNIENLEKSAKEEFLEYDAKQIEFLEQIGKELKNVEIKDYPEVVSFVNKMYHGRKKTKLKVMACYVFYRLTGRKDTWSMFEKMTKKFWYMQILGRFFTKLLVLGLPP